MPPDGFGKPQLIPDPPRACVEILIAVIRHRNTTIGYRHDLNWTLRDTGKSIAEATATLHGKSASFKNELLFQLGVNYNDVPLWQRRGTALHWERFDKLGFDPIRNQNVRASRRGIRETRTLPMKGDYDRLLLTIMGSSDPSVQSQSV